MPPCQLYTIPSLHTTSHHIHSSKSTSALCLDFGLVKHRRGNLARDISIRHKAAQQTSRRVTVDKDDSAVVLQAHGEQVALLVDGELARELAAGGDDLEELELAGGGVDLEVDERVGGDGLGRVVEVGDGGAVFGAGGDDEEVCVGLNMLVRRKREINISLGSLRLTERTTSDTA